MHTALSDLGLRHLYVLHPGNERYPLHERITALPLRRLPELEMMATDESNAGFARNPRGQKSEVRGQKLLWRLNHRPQHSPDFCALGSHLLMFNIRDVAAVMGEVQRRVGLAVFTIGISQFAHAC